MLIFFERHYTLPGSFHGVRGDIVPGIGLMVYICVQFEHSSPDSRHEQPCFSSRFLLLFDVFFMTKSAEKQRPGKAMFIAGIDVLPHINPRRPQPVRHGHVGCKNGGQGKSSLPKSNGHLCRK